MASRRNRRNTRRNRKNTRRNRRVNRRANRRMQGGEYSMPAPLGVDPMGDMTKQSLNQGQQFASFHANQHGGAALVGGPYPGIVGGEPLLSDNLAASARVGPLNAALNEIKGMQDGGRRRGSRRNRKGSRRNRKGSRRNRKGSRRNRRGSRRNRRGSRRNRRYRGGAMPAMNPGSTGAGGMLLPSSVTVPGMNPEWKLAENPRAFAPS